MNNRKLKAHLDKASWEACNAVLNSLARLSNNRNSSKVFQYQEIQPGGSKPRSIKISTAKKKEVLTIDANGKNSWSQTWVKSLNKKEQSNAINALLSTRINQTRTLLNAWSLIDDDLVETRWGRLPGRQSARIRNRNNKFIGTVSLDGFKPTKNFNKTWSQILELINGNWSAIPNANNLSKPALRSLFNASSAGSPNASLGDALGGIKSKDQKIAASKELDSIIGEGTREWIIENLEPDFGGVYVGRNWQLSQGSPSQIGTTLKHTVWLDSINAGRPTSIAVDPNNKQSIIAGMLNGGLWHSHNGGKNWNQVSDQDLGALLPANLYPTVAALRSPGTEETLMLAFSGEDLWEGSNGGSANGTNTLVSLDSGETWQLNTAATTDPVNDVRVIGQKLVLATEGGAVIYDISSGWGNVLSGNQLAGSIHRFDQIKSIPGDDNRVIARRGRFIYEYDLNTGQRVAIGRPNTASTADHARIETADLGDGNFRLYYLPAPNMGMPEETNTPDLATLYSIDLSTNFTGSSTTNVSPGNPIANPSTQWMAWGYTTSTPDPNNPGTTLFRSSLWDSLGEETAIDGAQQWFHTLELLADPVFPDKAYVGGTTLGYVLHPDQPAGNPQERGVNLHFDPAGFNSYVQRPTKFNENNQTFIQGPGPVSAAALDLEATNNGNQALANYLEKVQSFSNKNHADAQVLYTDGETLYYGNDGGINSFVVNPADTTESLLGGLTWSNFKAMNILAPSPYFGFYQPNWTNLNIELITNLYQGGHLNPQGNRWIAGAQDNGVSVGSYGNSTPHLISNGDGGSGFFGNLNTQRAWTNQRSTSWIYRIDENVSIGAGVDQGTAPIWSADTSTSDRRDGVLANNVITNMITNGTLLIRNGTSSESKGLSFFDDLTTPGRADVRAILGRNASGRRDPIVSINLRWIGAASGSSGNQFTTLASNSATSEQNILSFLAANNGRLYIELNRRNGDPDYIQLNPISTGTPPTTRLAISAIEADQPALKVSSDGGTSTRSLGTPINSRGAGFYFPAEQHPADRSVIGIADDSRIYVYSNPFEESESRASDYTRTVDLKRLRANVLGGTPFASKVTAFAFAPWDTTGKTIAVGFSNGQALLITNAFDYMTPTAESISLSPSAGKVEALSFSHPDRDDYGVRASDAFISISHDDKQYPQITRFINGQPTLDTDFASHPNGASNDNLIVGGDKIYVATNEGVHKGRVDGSSASWSKIGGTYFDNLPTTRVDNLDYSKRDGRLYAFTYGRGVYNYQTEYTFNPYSPYELVNIPPDWERHQFIHPLDLVEIILGIDDPRILNAQFDYSDTLKPALVNPGLPKGASFYRNDSDISSLGDWFNPETNNFISQDKLVSKLDVFADLTLLKNGTEFKKFKLDVNLDTASSASGKATVAKLDLTEPYNIVMKSIDNKDNKRSDFTGILTYGFQSDYLAEEGSIQAGTKIISFNKVKQKESRFFDSEPIFDVNTKSNSLSLYTKDWLNLDQAKSLTPTEANRALAGIPTPILTPLLDTLPLKKVDLSASIYTLSNRGKLSKKPIANLSESAGKGMWWVPESEGRYFVEIRDSKAGSLYGYDLVVGSKPADGHELTFPDRLKGFERFIAEGAGASTVKLDPLERSLTLLGLNSYPLKPKATNGLDFSEITKIAIDTAGPDSANRVKDQLDVLATSGDFLLDYSDLRAIKKDKNLYSRLHKDVEWQDINYETLNPKLLTFIDWSKVDINKASKSLSFSESKAGKLAYQLTGRKQITQLPIKAIKDLSTQQIQAISPKSVKGFFASQIEKISKQTFNAFGSKQLANLSRDALTGLTRQQLQTLNPDKITVFKPGIIKSISREAISGLKASTLDEFSRRQIKALGNDQLAGLSAQQIREADDFIGALSDQQRRALSLAPSPSNRLVDQFTDQDHRPGLSAVDPLA